VNGIVLTTLIATENFLALCYGVNML